MYTEHINHGDADMRYAIMYKTQKGSTKVWRNKFFATFLAAEDYLLEHEEETLVSWDVWIGEITK